MTMATFSDNENLYFSALRLEQKWQTAGQARDYYVRALDNDPEDVRCNTALGRWYMQRGQFALAESHLRKATDVLAKYGMLGHEGAAAYYLALCLKYMFVGQKNMTAQMARDVLDEAFAWARKSTADYAWKYAGFMLCAQISVMRGDNEEALYLVNKALNYCWNSTEARALKAALMNRMQVEQENFDEFCEESLHINQFNYAVLYEQGRTEEMVQEMDGDASKYNDLALSYVAAGFNDSALDILHTAIEQATTSPMTFYYMAWLTGNEEDARLASWCSEQLPVPDRVEAVIALAAFPDDEGAARMVNEVYAEANDRSDKLQQIEEYQAERRNVAEQIINECAQIHDRIKECELRGEDVSEAENDFASIQGRLAKAINLLEECLLLPDELVVTGRSVPNNDIYYLLGRAFEFRGKRLHRSGREFEAERIFCKASKMFRLGTQMVDGEENAGEGNAANTDKLRYAALCYKALGDEATYASLMRFANGKWKMENGE